MEKRYFSLPGYQKALLQIGRNYSPIPMTGSYSYGVCGEEVILYLVDVDDEVVALVLKGYVNRIKTSCLGEWFLVCVEVSNRDAENFSYEWVDIL